MLRGTSRLGASALRPCLASASASASAPRAAPALVRHASRLPTPSARPSRVVRRTHAEHNAPTAAHAARPSHGRQHAEAAAQHGQESESSTTAAAQHGQESESSTTAAAQHGQESESSTTAAAQHATHATPASQHGSSSKPLSFEDAVASPSSAAGVELPAKLSEALSAPVTLPHDEHAVLDPSEHKAVAHLLGQSAIVVTRQVEMMNIFLGYEQANRYQLLSPDGEALGFLLESEGSITSTMSRQLLRNHRPFKALVLAPDGSPLLRVHRGLTWINSTTRIFALPPNTAPGTGEEVGEGERLIGEVKQVWHAWRRRYELFRPDQEGEEGAMRQCANVDGGLLTWDFNLQDEQGRTVASCSRNFRGFARELFADVGQYVVSFEATQPNAGALPMPENNDDKALVPSSEAVRSLPLDERALALALAFTLDVDYFSRHSSAGHGGMMPWLWMPGTGGSTAGTSNEPAPQQGQGQDSRDIGPTSEMPGTTSADAGGLGGAAGMVGYDAWSRGSDDGATVRPDAQAPPTSTQQPDVWGSGTDADPWGAPPPSGDSSQSGGWDAGTGQVGAGEETWGEGSEPFEDAAGSLGDGGGGGWGIGDLFDGWGS